MGVVLARREINCPAGAGARGTKRRPIVSARKVGDHVEIDKEDVRAGQTGNHVRYILGAGVVLVIIGFGAVALGWFG